jgi:hypothetical protein
MQEDTECFTSPQPNRGFQVLSRFAWALGGECFQLRWTKASFPDCLQRLLSTLLTGRGEVETDGVVEEGICSCNQLRLGCWWTEEGQAKRRLVGLGRVPVNSLCLRSVKNKIGLLLSFVGKIISFPILIVK